MPALLTIISCGLEFKSVVVFSSSFCDSPLSVNNALYDANGKRTFGSDMLLTYMSSLLLIVDFVVMKSSADA